MGIPLLRLSVHSTKILSSRDHSHFITSFSYWRPLLDAKTLSRLHSESPCSSQERKGEHTRKEKYQREVAVRETGRSGVVGPVVGPDDGGIRMARAGQHRKARHATSCTNFEASTELGLKKSASPMAFLETTTAFIDAVRNSRNARRSAMRV